jgi:hypothetical protein
MTVQNLVSDHRNAGDRIANGAYEYNSVVVVLAGGTTAVIAPCDGKLVRAFITVGSLHDSSNGYLSIDLDNNTGTDKPMIDAVDNDTGLTDDTDIYDSKDLVLNSTASNLVVKEGEWLELVTVAQGTIGADSIITLVFEVD